MPTSSDNSLPNLVLEHMAITDAAMTKAAAAETAADALRTKIANAIPAVVDALVANQRIRPTEREKVASMLHSHEAALTLLTSLASHRNEAETGIGRLGTPDNYGSTKQASSNSPYTGHNRQSGVKASDIALFTGLGLAPPTE